MSDISMCLNNTCKQKDTCYRYRAKPAKWQSYAYFKPAKNIDGEYFSCNEWIRRRDENGNLRT